VRPIPNLDQALWVMPCDSNNPAADIPIISANMDAHEAVPTSDLCRQPPPRSCGSATTFGWPITPPCTAVESCRLVLPLFILDDTAPAPGRRVAPRAGGCITASMLCGSRWPNLGGEHNLSLIDGVASALPPAFPARQADGREAAGSRSAGPEQK
jgi:hypothetical protein